MTRKRLAQGLAFSRALVLSASLLLVAAELGHGAELPADTAVQCALQSSRLHFGRLSMQGSAVVHGKGELVVVCQNLAQEARNVELVVGFPTMGTPSVTLQSGRYALPVSFFLDAQYSIRWGDGSGGAQVLQLLVRLGPAEERTLHLPVYALLRNRREARAGAYLMQVPVQLTTSPR